VHGVGVDAVGEVGADGAGGSAFLGSVAPIRSRFFRMALSPSSAWIITGPEIMKVDQVLEEGTFLVHGVELLGFLARQVHHAGGHDLQAGAFETGVDLADDVLGHGVGLDDGEGAFDRHCWFLELDFEVFCHNRNTLVASHVDKASDFNRRGLADW
jgi:hypothetical protein